MEDPDLLRIPDQELGEVVTNASVLVESREEYDFIVSHLVEAGMLEREVLEETLHIRGEPVYNGMFGVHKGWQEQADGSWLRTHHRCLMKFDVHLLRDDADREGGGRNFGVELAWRRAAG